MDTEHYAKLESLYLKGNINSRLFPSTTIAISQGGAEISIEVSDQYYHAMQGVHGCVYFKLLDDAAFFAANSVVKDRMLLTTAFSIHFFRPVASGILRAEGRLLMAGKSLYTAQADLFNEQGKHLASGIGQFSKGSFEL